jgi:hypothetical protein
MAPPRIAIVRRFVWPRRSIPPPDPEFDVSTRSLFRVDDGGESRLSLGAHEWDAAMTIRRRRRGKS